MAKEPLGSNPEEELLQSEQGLQPTASSGDTRKPSLSSGDTRKPSSSSGDTRKL